MSVLEQLSDAQRTLIVSLPYRVGLWVSHSDVSGGETAEGEELQTLSNLIEGFSQQVFGSELLQYIMHETLTRRDEWSEWSAHLNRIPQQCVEAVRILQTCADEKDIKVYARRLMELAEAVAGAFREYEPPSGLQKCVVWCGYYVRTLRARRYNIPVPSFEQFLNISPKERLALEQLSDALGMNSEL